MGPEAQETAAYSGQGTDHSRLLWLPSGTAEKGHFSPLRLVVRSSSRLSPGTVVEVGQKKPVSGHRSDSNQTNWHFIQNNGGFVRRLQQPDQSQLKNLPSPPNFYPLVPVTLRHHIKKEEKELCT